jgi:hypothetical protein
MVPFRDADGLSFRVYYDLSLLGLKEMREVVREVGTCGKMLHRDRSVY